MIQTASPVAVVRRSSEAAHLTAALAERNASWNFLGLPNDALELVRQCVLDWIAVTLWEPSWMAQKFDIKWLQDPKGVFPPPQSYYWIGQKGFSLLEVMVAFLLFTIFVTAFLTATGYNVSDSTASEEQLLGAQHFLSTVCVCVASSLLELAMWLCRYHPLLSSPV